jgi:hypothetical protein
MDSNEIWITIILPLLLAQACLYIKSFYDNYMMHKNESLKFVFDEKVKNLKNVLENFYWPVYIKLLCIYQLNYNIPIKNKYEYISSDSDSGDEQEYDSNDEAIITVTKKCNNLYVKNGKKINCRSNIPINSTNICKRCRWRSENNELSSGSTLDSPTSSNSSNEIEREEETIEISIPMHMNDSENILDNFELKTILIDTKTVEIMEEKLNELYNEILEILEKNMFNVVYTEKVNKTIILFIKYCKIRNIINDGSIKQKYNPNYFGVTNNTNKLITVIEKIVIKYQKDYNNLIEKGAFSNN